MLNNSSKLFFPKIKYDFSQKISQNSNEDKLVNIYYLDWQRKEVKSNDELSSISFIDDKIKNLKFAIDDTYLKEIQRVSWASIAEWNQIRYLDKSLKHIYLLPAVAYIETAFRLLSDCLYDEETQFFYRKADKIIMPYLFLYKFWKNQITKNLILDFSRIQELMTLSMKETLTDEQQILINELLTFIHIDFGE